MPGEVLIAVFNPCNCPIDSWSHVQAEVLIAPSSMPQYPIEIGVNLLCPHIHVVNGLLLCTTVNYPVLTPEGLHKSVLNKAPCV